MWRLTMFAQAPRVSANPDQGVGINKFEREGMLLLMAGWFGYLLPPNRLETPRFARNR